MPTDILLYRDATIAFPLHEVVSGLNPLLKSCRVAVGRELVEIPGPGLSLASYDHLPRPFMKECADADIALVATAKRYDNNFFYHYAGRVAILSFAGWERLTNLPASNGLVFMLAELLLNFIHLSTSHKSSTGCVNDFRARKTEIDFGLRAAFICQECIKEFERTSPSKKERDILQDIRSVLDDVSAASRSNSDITDYWKRKTTDTGGGTGTYDVFLCHNSQEKEEVRELNERLKRERVKTWFDEDQLPPGKPWQPELEREIENTKSAAVVVGSSGRGPWQDHEVRAFLSEFTQRGCPVIPVILKSCKVPPDLPLFLKQFTWVDFRQTTPDPWKRLLWGIRGTKI